MSDEPVNEEGNALCLFFVIGLVIGIIIFIALLNIEGPAPPQF